MKKYAPLAAALVGVALLILLFGKYWPPSHWTVVPRSELLVKGRQTAQHFGLNVNNWKTYAVANVSKDSLLSLRITYVARKGESAAEAGFDSTGALIYWRAPDDFKPSQAAASNEAAAQSAFQFMAGSQAAAYQTPRRSAGDEAEEDEYEFRKNPAPGTPLRERIKVKVKSGVVERVEHKLYHSLSDDEDDDQQEGYWGVLAALSFTFNAIGFVIVLSIFILWATRRALNRRFQLRIAAAAFLIMLAALFFGSGWDKFHSVNLEHDSPGVPQFFAALTILLLVAVGRGISPVARPKWFSLEQLCLLAPLAKPTGESIAAGVLFSPLLVAIPFLITACGLFPGSSVWPQKAELLYDRSPFWDSAGIGIFSALFLFFGFALPALQRLIRAYWLRWLILLPVGTLFFADQARSVSGPIAAPLTAGLLTFALFSFIWSQFDMLAVLTAQLAGGFVMGLLILGQKHESIWSFMLALAALLAAREWCNRRGQPVAEGDPLATNPMLTGFRAEREKLLAEFSVARRAQQDMLPQSMPEIPGYSIAASCTPSLEVGGDLYDFLKLPDGRIGIGVADVSGKGVPAALYMTLTKGLLASVTKNSSKLGPVVEEVNRHLHGVTRKKVFVTMALGFLDAEKHLLQCVRAGHNPMVWRQRSKNMTTLVTPGGMGLGITASNVFRTQLKVQELELSDGDAVVFYSDGITEAMNRSLEQFGEQRLMDAVDRTDTLDATAAHDSILNEVRDFLDGVHPQDDMTLVVLRVGESQ